MRLLRPIPLTFIVILFPAVVSVGGWFATFDLFCESRPRGANVQHGLALAAGTSILSFLVLFFVLVLVRGDLRSWRPRYLIASVCVLEAAAVAVAIAFVALDSATYVSTDCGFMEREPNEVSHLQWLYGAWGLAIGALLYQALRIAKYSPPPPPPEPEPDVIGPPLD